MKKKIYGFICMIISVTIISCFGCQSQNTDTQEKSKIEESHEEKEMYKSAPLIKKDIQSPVPQKPTNEEIYSSIMQVYYNEFSKIGNLENVCESDMGSGQTLSLDDVGYVFMDLNGDGTDELITGKTEFGDVIAIYTYINGQVQQVAVSNERDYYYLCENLVIGNEGSKGASNSVSNYFKLASDGKLQLIEDVMYDDSMKYSSKTLDFTTFRNYGAAPGITYVQTSAPVKVINYSGYNVEAIFPKEVDSYIRGNSIVDEMVSSGYTGVGTFHYTTNVDYELQITVMDSLKRTDVVQWTVTGVNSNHNLSSQGITLVILSDRTLIYTTGEYELPGSEYYEATYGILDSLTSEELYYARNEIYAKHGMIFEDGTLQAHFELKPWYKGTTPARQFNDSCLSQQEKRNIELIHAYENGGLR